MTTQSSRAERLAEIKERAKSLWAIPKYDADWLLSELEAADATAADFRERAALAQANADAEHAENIDLHLALEEAKEALRPFAEWGDGGRLDGAQDTDVYRYPILVRAFRRAAEVAAKLEKP